MTKLILGSSSKPRFRLLERLCIPFEVAAPDIDETPLPNETPTELVLRLAKAKAQKVAEQFPNAFIIGADQIGVLENEMLCKPYTHENAVKQLKQMSGKKIDFVSGMCLLDSHTQTHQISQDTFSVTFRHLTPSMIENYLQKEQPLECAGSFKAERLGIALVQELHNVDFSALIGLPLIRLINMLNNVGLGPI